jgi:DNA modification methylase
MNDLLHRQHSSATGPVECLGQTFPNEQARREHYLKLLAEKLQESDLRKISGFPVGTDENILALSDPPYYTACPNPFIPDFVKYYGTEVKDSGGYAKEPFATDVSEGKSDSIYGAHTYHTKVPPKAIARYILHYTNPGDLILDGFSGTGMTGVAAQMCGDKACIEELGYRVDKDGSIRRRETDDGKDVWIPFSKVGPRLPLLNDLSPIATFITNNYGRLFNVRDFCIEAQDVLERVEQEVEWVYQNENGRVSNGIWSDVFYCPICSGEIVYWEAAVKNDEISKTFSCPSCGGTVGKASSKDDGALKLDRAFESKYDPYLGAVVKLPKLVLVEETVKRDKKALRVKPVGNMFNEMIRKIDSLSPLKSVPVAKFDGGRQTNKLINGSGIEYVHWMYTPRALFVYGKLWEAELSTPEFTSLFRFCLTGINNYISRKQGYFGGGGGVAGTLFTPSVHLERNIFDALRRKIKGVSEVNRKAAPRGCVTTQSSGSLANIPAQSIDYIFVDPPFGENFQYAELNSFAEAWLKVKTDTPKDCVMNYVHKKDLGFYMHAMKDAFGEFFRVLKPGRWMTVEFSNTQASVWNAIQAGLQEAGFVVANVSALDKQQGSFNAVTNTTSVKQDLVISAYKPDGGLEDRFLKYGGGSESVWDFVATHLGYIPVVKVKSGKLDFVAERDPRIIFDRMVSWFIRHNVPVPTSSQEFQAGLTSRFVERDGMIFLADQVSEYDKKRLQVSAAPQMELFVCDERSAIDWLTDFLKRRPSTYQELHPEFISQLGAGWKKHEAKPELSALLENNFIQFDGRGEVPPQIHSYLSTNHKDLRGLDKSNRQLIAKAMDRWYVPDPSKAQDLEKKRETALLKEFEGYQAATGRKLKEFRLEVLRAGFKAAWGAKNYKAIIAIAQKIPEDALQEDEKLLLWYDQALTRTEAGA